MFRTLTLNFVAVLSFAAALTIANDRTAQAVSVPGVTFTNTDYTFDSGFYSLGYEFTPNTNIYVTALGYYDRGGNGLAGPSQVGIFNQATTLLVSGASVTVPTGTGGTLVGNGPEGFYRYQTLTTPVLLTAGTTYRIAGETGSQTNYYAYQNYVGLAANPNITIGNGYYGSGSLTYPSNPSTYMGGQIFAGGNFLFEVPVPAPEPSSAMLLFGGASVLAMVRRRNRTRS